MLEKQRLFQLVVLERNTHFISSVNLCQTFSSLSLLYRGVFSYLHVLTHLLLISEKNNFVRCMYSHLTPAVLHLNFCRSLLVICLSKFTFASFGL